jgi:hypothetical protein
MEEQLILLREFVEWAEENSPDAWYIYENTEEAISRFIEEKMMNNYNYVTSNQ